MVYGQAIHSVPTFSLPSFQLFCSLANCNYNEPNKLASVKEKMTTKLPQKYQGVAKALIPYISDDTSQQMMLIEVKPSLPCFICGQPAREALIAPASGYAANVGSAWVTFPICLSCEERQVKSQVAASE